MNELTSINALPPISSSALIIKALSSLNQKNILILGSLICITTVVCIGFVSMSGSEMSLSKNGLCITQPDVSI